MRKGRINKSEQWQRKDTPRNIGRIGTAGAETFGAMVAPVAEEWSPPPAEQTGMQQHQGDLGQRILALLEQAGLPEDQLQQVRDLIDSEGNGDGTLHLQHEGDAPMVQTTKAFDRRKRRTASDQEESGSSAYHSRANMDQPPPFGGRPGESIDPMMPPDSGEAQRDAALENMSRIQSLTPGDLVYKDGTPFTGTTPNGDQFIHGARLRRPAPAMDEASAKGFFARFPDARRIRSV
jgi:hypothetical protein